MRGIISLIQKKKEKSPFLLKNWRPLSLLNVDYKLLAKTIAVGIKSVLLHVIHDDQIGFIKTRYIGQNICQIHDIMNFAENEDIPALLIAIDFEKAFDCLEWVFLRDCTLKLNFPDHILRWVELLHTDINSCVTCNRIFQIRTRSSSRMPTFSLLIHQSRWSTSPSNQAKW